MENIFFDLSLIAAILFLLSAMVITIVSLIRNKDKDHLWIGVLGIYLILTFIVFDIYLGR
jgi:hypothetical protein